MSLRIAVLKLPPKGLACTAEAADEAVWVATSDKAEDKREKEPGESNGPEVLSDEVQQEPEATHGFVLSSQSRGGPVEAPRPA